MPTRKLSTKKTGNTSLSISIGRPVKIKSKSRQGGKLTDKIKRIGNGQDDQDSHVGGQVLSESSSESVSSKVSDNSERWAAIERRQKEKEMEERARRSEYTKLKKGLTTQPANARALGQRYGRNSATLSTRPSLQKRRSVFGFGPEGLSKELLAQLGAPGEREQPGGR